MSRTSKKNDRKYKLVVDCKAEYCHTVQAHMKSIGFHVRKNDTSLGDHYGIKLFRSEQDANDTADEIFNKFSTYVRQIAVLPYT